MYYKVLHITIYSYITPRDMLFINDTKTIIKSLHTRTSLMIVEFISIIFQTVERLTNTTVAQSFSD